MKKLGFIFCSVCLMAACNNEGSSTGNKLDSLGDKIENTADKTLDSAKAKGERVIDRIEDKLDRKDSAKKAQQDTSKH